MNELTVEQAITELQQMFPNESRGSIEATFFDEVGMRVRIGLRDVNHHWTAPTLDDAMAQVRDWKALKSLATS